MKNKLILFIYISLLFAACSQPVKPAAPEVVPAEPGLIFLTTAQLKQAGIQTAGFEKRSMTNEMPANAEIVLAPEHQATVSALTDGTVSRLLVRLNQTVRQGQPVVTLYKPDLLDWQQEFLETQNKLAFFEAEYERYRLLKEADATAAKNFVRAEADLRSARTTLQLLSAKLRQYQINPDKLSTDNLKTEYTLTAPISGTITHIDASVGQALTPGSSVCELADYTKLYPLLYVLERDLSALKPGLRVELHPAGTTDRTYTAEITQLERSLDPEKRAVRVHTRFTAAPPADCILGAYLQARIQASTAVAVPTLPKEAIVHENEGDFIFIRERQTPEGAFFRKLKVQLGASDQVRSAIQTPMPSADSAAVVVKGAYYVSAAGSGVEIAE